MLKYLKYLIPVVVLTFTGCSVDGSEELRQWMVEQKSLTKPKVKALSAPKAFHPTAYEGMKGDEPFSSQKLISSLKKESGISEKSSGILLAEQTRRKGPLEAYPLDMLTMVGSLNKNGRRIALIRVNNMLYQATAGEYLGQNFGLIQSLGEAQIKIREIVQDSAGEWIERFVFLNLQEESK
ncbi:MAG: putative type pilus assembly protein PilP, putative lipoprotein of the pilotin family [Pseudomonadota bacterium]|jgi:type IV pilus assembly protein PilP